MKTILKYLQPFRLRMAISLLIKILASLAELTLPYILSYIFVNSAFNTVKGGLELI